YKGALSAKDFSHMSA
ncbi:hypothetical protein NPIL_209631, partial [Nephila pilipes]